MLGQCCVIASIFVLNKEQISSDVDYTLSKTIQIQHAKQWFLTEVPIYVCVVFNYYKTGHKALISVFGWHK